MSKLVVNGATLKCDQGASTSKLTVTAHGVEENGPAMATVDDYAPMVNVPPFGMCQTTSNPQVASATSAAQGVLTPQPCVPVITARWSGGATGTTIDGVAALLDSSTCSCQWSGTVSISDPSSGVEGS